MSEPINNIPAEAPETTPEKTFNQAEVEAMIGKRLAKAMKGMPGEEELAAFRTWKESQQTEKERWDNLTQERDTANAALSAAQAELEQYKREKHLLSQGVSAEDVDYYAFKIGKLVTDDTPFEKAAEQFLQEHKPKEPKQEPGTIRVNFSAPLNGGGEHRPSLNERINNQLRGM